MTSTELKHQARLQEWSAAIQDCRSSQLPVKQRCRERGITTTTYYRWERELLAIADAASDLPQSPTVAFAELPSPQQPCQNTAECSAILRIGDGCIEFYQELSPDLLRTMVGVLRSC